MRRSPLFDFERSNNPKSLKSFIFRNRHYRAAFLHFKNSYSTKHRYDRTIFRHKTVAPIQRLLDFLELSTHCPLFKWLYLKTKVCNSLG